LLNYIYKPEVPGSEAPRPFFHPLYSLAGNLVSGFRPYDHYWHHGLSMTCANLSGQNFWGGPTYVRDEGYIDLDNRGRQICKKINDVKQSEDEVVFDHHINWYTSNDENWLTEQRAWRFAGCQIDNSYLLDIKMQLTNVSGKNLEFGSPTTEGRPEAGYGGLFWRGPRDFIGGEVFDSEGRQSASDIMGKPASWLAYSGKHDNSFNKSTLVFIDHPDNPRYPNKWFVRTERFPVVSFAFTFDKIYTLADKARLKLNYRIVVVDGEVNVEQINEIAENFSNKIK
jgi:hypothetical protein